MKIISHCAIVLLVFIASSCSNTHVNTETGRMPTRVDILLAGSSTMEFWTDYYNYFDDYTTANTGKASATVGQLLDDYDSIFGAYRAKYTVLYVGENDAKTVSHEVFLPGF